jgi:hypothetical protein
MTLRQFFTVTIALLVGAAAAPALAADSNSPPITLLIPDRPLATAHPSARWREVESSVDRALAWLAAQQNADGSFPCIDAGQPAVTSLSIMAFLSRGHQPGIGPYGDRINRAIDYVLSCQNADGLISRSNPDTQPPATVSAGAVRSVSVVLTRNPPTYNHAISGLMLSEAYGQITGKRAADTRTAIERALQFTRHLQTIRPKSDADKGGWRYLAPGAPFDSDLSVTAWHLMFLRSAKNAGFNVPDEWVNEAVEFIRRCWDPKTGAFFYGIEPSGNQVVAIRNTIRQETRALAGSGILALSLAGQHQTEMAQAAGNWLLAHPFPNLNEADAQRERFFYATYYCTQAAVQLGGRYTDQIYPQIANVLLTCQLPDGGWPPERSSAPFGRTYSTAFAVLSLTPPYQLLPVYQR